MNKKKRPILSFITFSTFIFLYLPIIAVTIYSFNTSQSGFKFEGFTFRWYKVLFHDSMIMDAMKNTLSIAFLSSFISTFIGVLGAYTIYKAKHKKLKDVYLFTNSISIINPDLITGISLFIFFIFLHLNLGYLTLLLSHIAFSIPYAVLIIYPKLTAISPYSIEAALDLGASESQTFFKIILPDIKPAILSALLICFTLSIDDFIISFFTTGNNINNLSIIIYSIARRGINTSINALSALMFVVIFSLLFIINRKFSLTDIEDVNK